MAKAKGSLFEELSKKFLEDLLSDMDFLVISVRRQQAGTQYGFDLKVKFADENDQTHTIHFECKDYTTTLDWKELSVKIIDLAATPYEPDGFVALSPKKDITNIEDRVLSDLEKRVRFPIDIWEPCSKIQEIFAINEKIYEEIYGEKPKFKIDKKQVIHRTRIIVNNILQRKLALKYIRIIIDEAKRKPKEDAEYITTLDKKLNAILNKDHPLRLEYHQSRCDYKVYLEELESLDNDLRLTIIRWQNDLRKKAKRLTNKFIIDSNYDSAAFFHDFFKEAENSLMVHITTANISAEIEKLLWGIVFELAAECPLDWRR